MLRAQTGAVGVTAVRGGHRTGEVVQGMNGMLMGVEAAGEAEGRPLRLRVKRFPRSNDGAERQPPACRAEFLQTLETSPAHPSWARSIGSVRPTGTTAARQASVPPGPLKVVEAAGAEDLSTLR